MPARRPDTPASTDQPRARSPRASGRVTLKDVALSLGVSSMTVSRALRSGTGVDPQLLERIRSTALEMGYVPDPAARALASQKSNQILMLVPMLSNGLFVELIEAAQTQLIAAGYQTTIGVTHYDQGQELQLLQSYLPLRPAGLLVTGLDHSPEAQKLIDCSGVPCIHMMELSPSPEVSCVGFSQEEAGAAMTRHLIAQGRKRIAFCAGQLDPRVLQRANGWRQALEQARLYDPLLQVLWPQPTSMAMGAEMLRETLARDPSIDAIFFCNDDIAQGAAMEALRLGLAVPQRVAIGGFNDLPGSDQMIPPLTTIRTPRAEIGAVSAQLLLQLLHKKAPLGSRKDLGYELIVRAST